MSRSEALRRGVSAVAALAALAVAGFGWWSSRVGEYSVMDMGGHARHGGASAGGVAAVGVAALRVDPGRPADVRVRLVARQGVVAVPGGRAVDGYTVNGTSPGPTVRARAGQLVEVVFVNESVAAGATLHWHGLDVPNAADGVAGVTQDAVPVGGSHVYRFIAEAGSYWYHSHQLSHEQVERGLLGAVVVDPATGPPRGVTDVVALLHVYAGQHTLGGRLEDARVAAPAGSRVRVRVVNTDQGTAAVWASGPYRVVAVDGRDVVGPTEVVGRRVLVPAGGRLDVELVSPADGGTALLHVGGARTVVVGSGVASGAGTTRPPERVPQPSDTLDLLAYGSPAPLGFDAGRPDRTYPYVIGRRPGLLDGRPGFWWTVNGRMFPDVPMFEVRVGDVVRMRLANESDDVHPMHLHGHHFVVLSRDSVAASGSPLWLDSLDVNPGESYEIAFVADNPGIWSDHCHTLEHAAEGLVAHVMYEGVTTPYLVNGSAGNHPE